VTSNDAAVAAGVREMGHIFRGHQRENEVADLSGLSISQAYQVQEGFLGGRVEEGARVVGWKVGCTSAAIRRQFGLTQPISGKLMEPDIHRDGADLPASRYVDCAVEPELVFRLGSDIDGEADEETVIRAIAGVSAGIELHNYRFWYGKPTSQELIASNGIHAGLVLAEERPFPPNWDINSEEVSILVNGELKASGKCAEIMGGPLVSMKWLARHSSERGSRLRAGELVIPGSAVELVRVAAGDSIEARFSTLGSCHAHLI
jgi:2-keto-4-pentenoate hydratase